MPTINLPLKWLIGAGVALLLLGGVIVQSNRLQVEREWRASIADVLNCSETDRKAVLNCANIAADDSAELASLLAQREEAAARAARADEALEREQSTNTHKFEAAKVVIERLETVPTTIDEDSLTPWEGWTQ